MKRKGDEDSSSDDDFGPARPGAGAVKASKDDEKVKPPAKKQKETDGDDDDDFGPPRPGSVKPQDEKEEEDSDDDFGPARPAAVPDKIAKPKKVRKPKHTKAFYDLHEQALPSAEMYEKSYMHRETLTQILVTSSQFVVTASRDGVLKFWKKTADGLEFVKQFKAHMGPIVSIAASADGFLLASVSNDKSIKIFDIINFDMIHMLQLDYVPTTCCWIHDKNSAKGFIAVGARDSGDIRIYKATGESKPVRVVKCHSNPVSHIKYNKQFKCCISIDSRGMVEYWSTETFEFPTNVKFKFKTDTSLYEFLKNKTSPTSLTISPDGSMFATMSRDRKIRVFRFATGKLIRSYDTSLQMFEDLQKSGEETYKLDPIDFGRRMAIERELHKASNAPTNETETFIPPSNVIFDRSSTFIMYPTLLGIKILNVETNKLVRICGRVENTERFLGIAVFQGTAEEIGQSVQQSRGSDLVGTGGSALAATPEDPCVFAIAYKKKRFYWFSKREPLEPDSLSLGRDVFNEKPTKEVGSMATNTAAQLGRSVIMHTTMGDITIDLFTDECPKTVENFVTHSRNGYYDNTTFHRVIKEFMIQGGDPQGDGTGGESIWGGEFEDEIRRELRHDRPGVLSMANAGANTNGSQFFITCVPCPWLNDKHTVFGHVVKGMECIHNIEKVKVLDQKPLKAIRVINIDVK